MRFAITFLALALLLIPSTTSSCSSFVSTGVTDNRTITQDQIVLEKFVDVSNRPSDHLPGVRPLIHELFEHSRIRMLRCETQPQQLESHACHFLN